MNVTLRPDPPGGPSKGKIVLFFPRFGFQQYPVWMPLEIMTLGAGLRRAGYTVRLVDERLEPNAVGLLEHDIADAIFVGISSRPGDQVPRAIELFRLLKHHHPGVKTLWGGWFPSSFPDACLAVPEVDFIAQGAADQSIVELADALCGRGDPSEIQGISSRIDGTVRRNPRRRLEPLDETAAIPWELFPVDRYMTVDKVINLFTSRGCPGLCRFCGVPSVFPGVWTGFAAERVVDDFAAMASRWGARIVKLVDVDFFPDHDRAKAICRGIIDRGIRVRWVVDVRIKDVIRFDDEMWDLLVRSGCAELETGAESGDDQQLETMRKECNADETIRAVRAIVDRGIAARVNIILGLPREHDRELGNTLGLIARLARFGDLVKFQFYRYTPNPATRFGSETWRTKKRGHDGRPPTEIESMMQVPINFHEADMFWLDEAYERKLKRLYYWYLPLVHYLRDDGRSGVRSLGLRLIVAFARLRFRLRCFALPFEPALLRFLDRPMPRSREFEWVQRVDVLPN